MDNRSKTEVIDINVHREVQKIETYIRNTERPENIRYDVSACDIRLLGEMAINGQLFNALMLAIQYGKAKETLI